MFWLKLLFFVSRAQAGFEYLMTYGWALVLFFTVASVLFFVFTPNSQQMKCFSSEPSKFPLKATNFPEESHGFGAGYDNWMSPSQDAPIELRFQNATGGKIKITSINCWGSGNWDNLCTSAFYFNPAISFPYSKVNGANFGSSSTYFSPPINVDEGSGISIKYFTVSYSPSLKTVPPGKFRINYTDQFGNDNYFAVTCEGFPSPLKGNY